MSIRTLTMADACTGMLKTMLVIVTITLLCEMGIGQQPTTKLTLNDVLALANQHNLDLAAARAKRAAALAGIRIAKERPNPTLTVGGSPDLPPGNALLDHPFEPEPNLPN